MYQTIIYELSFSNKKPDKISINLIANENLLDSKKLILFIYK